MTRKTDTANSNSTTNKPSVDVNVDVDAPGDVNVNVGVDVSIFPRENIEQNYYLTRHAGQRLREDDRELNQAILCNTISKGDASPAVGDAVAFELEVGPTTYTVIVGTDRDSDGYPIITAYPDFDKPDLSQLPDEYL